MSLQYALSRASDSAQTAELATNEYDSKAARERCQKWSETVLGMATGDINVGSRTPLRNVPVFLTPDVLKGGFASGRLRAGGTLLPFEKSLADGTAGPNDCFGHAYSNAPFDVPVPRNSNVRQVRKELNTRFLEPSGISALIRLLHERTYRVAVPEEGAFLVVAWLFEREEAAAARKLVGEIAPYFPLVRFYPRPASTPVDVDLKCSRSTVADFKKSLQRRKSKGLSSTCLRYSTTKLVVEELLPAYDELLSIVLATCHKVPTSCAPAKGKDEYTLHDTSATSIPEPDLLLPFQRAPSKAMLVAFNNLSARFECIERRANELRTGRPQRTLGQLSTSRNCGAVLEAARAFYSTRTAKPSPRQVRFVRTILLGIHCNSRRCLPRAWSGDWGAHGSATTSRCSAKEEREANRHIPDRLAAFRKTQRQYTLRDVHILSADWIRILENRISKLHVTDDAGLDEVDDLQAPCSESEEKVSQLRRGTPVPPAAVREIVLLERGTLEELLERGFVPSMETLATLVDELVGCAKTQGSADDAFRALYTSIMTAFRRRRSLLMLNLQQQVKFEELPWASPLETAYRRQIGGARHTGLHALLGKLIRVCISRWPEAMIPNKMVSALNVVGTAARVKTKRGTWVHLMPELAADIFCDALTEKWSVHARIAKDRLQGSLYDKYYECSEKHCWNELGENSGHQDIGVIQRSCEDVAGAFDWRAYSVARNGVYIETAMILTTHNLAYLFEVLEAIGAEFSQEEVLALCNDSFQKLSSALKKATPAQTPWQTKLQITKRVAYGWRQLVFLTTMLNQSQARAFFLENMSKRNAAAGCHLQRALADLYAVWLWLEDRPHDVARRARPWKPFVGWTQESQHPILNPDWCEKLKARITEADNDAPDRGRSASPDAHCDPE